MRFFKLKLNYAKMRDDLGSIGKSMISMGFGSALINWVLSYQSEGFKESLLATAGAIIAVFGLIFWLVSLISLEE